MQNVLHLKEGKDEKYQCSISNYNGLLCVVDKLYGKALNKSGDTLDVQQGNHSNEDYRGVEDVRNSVCCEAGEWNAYT